MDSVAGTFGSLFGARPSLPSQGLDGLLPGPDAPGGDGIFSGDRPSFGRMAAQFAGIDDHRANPEPPLARGSSDAKPGWRTDASNDPPDRAGPSRSEEKPVADSAPPRSETKSSTDRDPETDSVSGKSGSSDGKPGVESDGSGDTAGEDPDGGKDRKAAGQQLASDMPTPNLGAAAGLLAESARMITPPSLAIAAAKAASDGVSQSTGADDTTGAIKDTGASAATAAAPAASAENGKSAAATATAASAVETTAADRASGRPASGSQFSKLAETYNTAAANASGLESGGGQNQTGNGDTDGKAPFAVTASIRDTNAIATDKLSQSAFLVVAAAEADPTQAAVQSGLQSGPQPEADVAGNPVMALLTDAADGADSANGGKPVDNATPATLPAGAQPLGLRAPTAQPAASILQTTAMRDLASMSPIEQVAVHVSQAIEDGQSHITLHLRPAALGQIEVRLDLGRDGRVSAVVAADRPDTLYLLQSDSQGLQRALADAGLKADAGSVQFQLRGDSQGQGHGHGQGQQQPQFSRADTPPEIGLAPYISETMPMTPGSQSMSDVGRLDIRV